MSKAKALAIRKPQLPVLSGIPNWVFLVGLGILIYWLFRRNQPVASIGYRNKATWDIQLNEDGIPVKVTVTRDVKPQ